MIKYSKLLSRITDYLKDKLTNNERHTLEQEINADPFLSDAMDGFEKLPQQELENDLATLTSKLNNRAQPKQQKSLYLYISVAASVAVILGISVFYYNTNTDNAQLADNIELEKLKKANKELELEREKVIPATKVFIPQVDSNIAQQPKAVKQTEKRTQTPVLYSEDIARKRKEKPTGKASKATAQQVHHIAIEQQKAVMPPQEPTLAPVIESEAITNKGREKQVKVAPKTTSPNQQVINAYKVKGVVKDKESYPIPGTSVLVKGSTAGTISNFEGEYELDVKPGDTLVYSFIGFEPKEGVVSNEVAQLDDVTLNPDIKIVEEVVVVGYGTMKKREVTGAVVSISADAIANAPKIKSSQLQGNRLQSEESEKPVIIKQETYTPEGGFRKFRKYIKTNKRIQLDTKLQVELTLDQAGKPTQIQILTPYTNEVSTEVTRLFTQGPLWQRKSKTYDSNNNKTTVTIKL